MSLDSNIQRLLQAKDDALTEKDKEIAQLKKSFQMSQDARKEWLNEFDGYKQRIAEARRLIEHIGTVGVERTDIIFAAEKWLEGTP